MHNHTIILKKGKAISISRFHPWVFSGAIYSDTRKIKDGDLVDIFSYEKTFLAKGHFQSGGSIAIRILSFAEIEIDLAFWVDKFRKAIQYRQVFDIPSPNTNAYRLIHGEGDGLPGLIIDIYNNIGVIQCHSIGMYLDAQLIGEALKQVLGDQLDTIFVRAKDTLPKTFAAGIEDRFLIGSQSTTTVTENQVLFDIDVITGQKTGFFLDQRENRALVGRFAKGKEILNCFCYTGGFSLLALQGGATHVDSVDISQKAVDLMEKNLALNPFAATHRSICADVLQFLSDKSLKQYDVVIVDPPAFAKSLHKRHNAVQAYKRLNALALQKVKPGGLLFTFSCSQVVGTQLFYDTIVAAGIESGKNIKVMQSLSQGPDHPINLYHPEGHYLKGLMLYVE
jgi:23S rRNA (cytosine1962-C5)-methyltransferase